MRGGRSDLSPLL